ncbi:MAG: hypothetical protein HRU70_03665 [Phycisphaeraceae bacterium]|nr:MAG: hypothetical protein HRU70_03665 [Phycisphaeraceae bacterium]
MTRPGATRRARRGFSMLELAMASVVSTVVLFASFSVFSMLTKSNTRTHERFISTIDLERTRRAFHAAFLSLVTSPRAPLRSEATNPRAAVVAGDQEGAAEEPQRPEPTQAPRLRLAQDFSPRVSAALSAAGTDGFVPRLEMVVSRSPVPVKRRGSLSGALNAGGASDDRDRPDTSTSGGRLAIRGAFELVPHFTTPSERRRNPDAPQMVWELWWTPLPPIPENPEVEPPPISMAAGYPVKLCGDLIRATIRLRKDSGWQSQYDAASQTELPAFANVKLEFADGTKADWLFELDFSVGVEVALNPEDADPGAGPEAGPGGGGPGGGGPGGGGPGGGRGERWQRPVRTGGAPR